MGISTPSCHKTPFCGIYNFILSYVSYFHLIQNQIAPTNYMRSERNYDGYLKGNILLPYLNNEKSHANAEKFKDRVKHLNGVMLAMNLEDSILHPRQTAQFGSLDQND